MPKQQRGFRRVIIDEQRDSNGSLSYAVTLYTDQCARVITRVHPDYNSAAIEMMDWMEWSSLRPLDTAAVNSRLTTRR